MNPVGAPNPIYNYSERPMTTRRDGSSPVPRHPSSSEVTIGLRRLRGPSYKISCGTCLRLSVLSGSSRPDEPLTADVLDPTPDHSRRDHPLRSGTFDLRRDCGDRRMYIVDLALCRFSKQPKSVSLEAKLRMLKVIYRHTDLSNWQDFERRKNTTVTDGSTSL